MSSSATVISNPNRDRLRFPARGLGPITLALEVALLLVLATNVAVPAAAPFAPLADACQRQDWEAAKALLDSHADVSAAQPDGMTALHWAVYHDHVPTVERLLAAGADARATSRYQVAPLSLACLNGNEKIVKLLLEAGADPNTTLPGGETALMTAARTGRPGPVQALLERGADVNARERKGQTALMWAAAEGNLEAVDLLLRAGADFRTPLPSGFTPFFFAVREGKAAVVFRLLDAGIDVNATLEPRRGGPARSKPTNALLLAVENGHFELADALLERGADPNGRPAGYTALHALTWVRKPIRGDGDPPPQGSGGMDSLTLVRRLVAHGAEVNARLEKGESGRGRFTTTGATPFLLAARASDVPLMRLLLELGADPQIPNADHCPPLLAAAGVGALGDGDEAAGTDEEALAACKLLLELGADVNAVDDHGETVMHGAAYQSRASLVAFLDAHGADIQVWNRKNRWGWTPLMIAQGHRPGNFRPSPETIAAIERVMRAHGVEPPPPVPRDTRPPEYK
jgi:ankyrin repeat protein